LIIYGILGGIGAIIAQAVVENGLLRAIVGGAIVFLAGYLISRFAPSLLYKPRTPTS
jgi:hypothetical protein